MAVKNKTTNAVEPETIPEDLKKDIEENAEDLKKGGTKFWSFVWKWTKRLAVPIALIVGWILKSIFSGHGDNTDDEEEECDPAETESPEEDPE